MAVILSDWQGGKQFEEKPYLFKFEEWEIDGVTGTPWMSRVPCATSRSENIGQLAFYWMMHSGEQGVILP